jgi:hypothetical protein
LDGFGDVFGGDVGGLGEVGDGAGDFEDAVMGAGGEAHAADGQLQGAFAGVVEGADFADLAGRDFGVDEAAGGLEFTGGKDAGAHLGGGSAGGFGPEFLKGNGGNFDVEVNAIEQRAGDLAEVLGDLGAGTPAFAGGVAVEAAFALEATSRITNGLSRSATLSASHFSS